MRKKLSLIAIVLASFLFVLYSCTKQENAERADPQKELVLAAKKLYESSPHASLSIAWDHPVFSSDFKRVSFPLIWTATFEVRQKSYRRLVVSQDKQKKLTGEIMEAIPTVSYFNAHPKGINNTDFEGTVGAYDFDMKFKYADYYEKGALKYKSEIKTFKSKEAYNNTPKPEGCYSVQTTYTSNGVLNVISYYHCDPDNVGGPVSGEQGQGSDRGGPSIDRFDKADPDWDGGSGGSGEPIYNIVKNPCDEKKVISTNAQNSTVKAQNDKVSSYLNSSPNEYGTEHILKDYQNPSAGYKDAPVRTDNQPASIKSKFTWNASDGYTIGFVHDHPGNTAPSPDDVFDMVQYAMNNQDLERSWGGKAFYLSNVSATIITPGGTYVVTINDWDVLKGIYQNFIKDQTAFDDNFITTANAYQSGVVGLLKTFGNSINLYWTEPGTTNFIPLTVSITNKPSTKDCPQ